MEKNEAGKQVSQKEEDNLPVPARTYKDRVFRMVFKEKKELLGLYNAMNGTAYTDPEELTVTTLENAIYMGMKNDVSFLLHDRLSLYEHQSTDNPNIPLRNLLYVAAIYSGMTQGEVLYQPRPVPLPEPRFVEFYNGEKALPERSERKLSDLYTNHTGNPALELKTLVLNINPGYNAELMEKCRTLREYMLFVSKARRYRKEMPLAEAMERAVTECIEENILADFLKKNRAEVVNVVLYEYDEKLYIQLEREYAKEEGKIEGKAESILELLEGLGPVPDDLRKTVMEEKNMDVLGRWLRQAARAKSIRQFREAM